ncbi:MAG: efflux transporter outer membrane subunit [Gammaproteobacteria bacterium]|nr:efflux transporter outer membrane subunit [Gammaproteobacteria bacterium]
MLSLLSACALKSPPPPSELREQTLSHAPLPEQWSANIVSEGAVQDGWVNNFNDPALKSLVAEALEHNTDLRVAAARVEQAAGYARVAGAAIYPAVNLLARGGGPLSGDGSGLEGAWLNASWELDLWGRVRAGRAAATAQYESTEADYIYARQALAAAVTKSWFLAIEARLQRSIAEEMVVAGERLVDVARQRLRVGADDEYNVVVAEASLGGFRDTLLQLEFGYQQAVRALEVLLGRYPSATLLTAEQLPALPPPIPAGLPSELLERRPDVIAAERRVATAFYGITEAKAARLPKISLTASVSTISSELFVLQDRDNPVWSAGASLLAPIFQGGALKAQVEIRTAEQKQALAEYARIGLRAFNDVETAMYSELMLRSREQVLNRAVADNKRALELAEVRYRVGATDLRAISQQQLDLLSVQTTLLRVRSEARVQRVNLHLALGGSFDIPPPAEPAPTEKSASDSGATQP